MTVFRGYMLLIKRNLGMLFLYTTIFMIITVLIQISLGDSQKTSYAPVKLKVAVVNKDKGALSQGLVKMLEQKHTIVDISDDKSVLQEAMFYGNVNYVVEIPQDFEQKALVDGEKVAVTKRPGQYESVYADQQITQFLNQVKQYYTAGYDVEQAVEKVLLQTKNGADITMIDGAGGGEHMPAYTFMFQFFPYLYLAVVCYCMGCILVIFKERNVRRRMLCSSVSLNSQSIQSVMAYAIMGIAFWGISLLMPVLTYRGEFWGDPNRWYYILNSFVLLLVAIGIALVAGAVSRNVIVLNPIVNVISLGMCFTCGVFVSTTIMSKSVLQVAQFLPVYWYVNNTTLLGSHADLAGKFQGIYFKGIWIQAIYAVALLCVAMVIMKSKSRAE